MDFMVDSKPEADDQVQVLFFLMATYFTWHFPYKIITSISLKCCIQGRYKALKQQGIDYATTFQ